MIGPTPPEIGDRARCAAPVGGEATGMGVLHVHQITVQVKDAEKNASS
jgi:hypothetical protein